MSKTYPAQIVFTESDTGGRWSGRLLRGSVAVDRATGHPVPATSRPRFDITEDAPRGFLVTMQGGHRSGRRYRRYKTLTDAQKAGIRWAGRRFRVPA